jgi:hypothetical protein
MRFERSKEKNICSAQLSGAECPRFSILPMPDSKAIYYNRNEWKLQSFSIIKSLKND